jgi:phenylalanyl-tRNA synthetase beta chain
VVDADCSNLGYFGVSLGGVKVTTSPAWLSRRLEEVGMRSINNIVDISNYVMLELGIPNHIFDREKISGNTLHIKRAGTEQSFVTLDGVSRALQASDTIIADQEKTLVLAGLMGGENSGVSESTTKIFIEVANWKAAQVRTTSVRLGLRTDSSQRYEKTLDSQMLTRTLYRLVELVQKVCPEAVIIGSQEYAGPTLPLKAPLLITTSVHKIQKVLGKLIDPQTIRRIFTSLDFNLSGSDEKLVVTIPSYRTTKDIECEADLVEEIGRHVGFDNITPEAPLVPVAPANLSSKQKLQRKIRDYLIQNAHASEAMTYPMLGEKLQTKMQWSPQSTLKILNSLSEDHDRMRDSLIPSLLEACTLNTKNFEDFRFFELGRTYQQDAKNFSRENSLLGIVFNDTEATPFLKLVDHFESLLITLQIPYDLVGRDEKFKNPLIQDSWIGLHPYEYLNVRVMGKFQGVIFSLHPLFAKKLKLKGNYSLALLDLSSFENNPIKDKTKYSQIAKFPHATFDCTVMTSTDTSVAAILDVVQKMRLSELQSCKVVGTYQVTPNEKSVTLRSVFANSEATLSGESIKNLENMLCDKLRQEGFPLKQ